MNNNDFLEWLKENKISGSGKYKGKRWGSITEKQSDLIVRVCCQYDDFLETFLSNESVENQKLVKNRNGYEGCGRCIDGKCAFTGFDVINPDENQISIIKKMILYRIEAIKEERIPNCSYVKLSKRNEPIPPCSIHKVCNPKCKAMKKY